jgi:hypothetical protein
LSDSGNPFNVTGGSQIIQLRIIIECAFGMLVQRWSILRSPLSSTMGGKRQISVAIAACRLHNFCISRRLLRGQNNLEGVESYSMDLVDQIRTGYAVGNIENEMEIPDALLDGGAHFDDIADGVLPQQESSMPRLRLCRLVQAKGLRRKVSG